MKNGEERLMTANVERLRVDFLLVTFTYRCFLNLKKHEDYMEMTMKTKQKRFVRICIGFMIEKCLMLYIAFTIVYDFFFFMTKIMRLVFKLKYYPIL